MIDVTVVVTVVVVLVLVAVVAAMAALGLLGVLSGMRFIAPCPVCGRWELELPGVVLTSATSARAAGPCRHCRREQARAALR